MQIDRQGPVSVLERKEGRRLDVGGLAQILEICILFIINMLRAYLRMVSDNISSLFREI